MTEIKLEIKTHPKDTELADYLSRSLSEKDRLIVEEHAATCDECLNKIVSAYESVEKAGIKIPGKRERLKFMKKINVYLILAVVSFALSFTTQQYFLQFLVATLLLGAKWVADSKSTKMLIMIHEAWKRGGTEADRILKDLDPKSNKRF
ncbi:MAG: zf-HC2 domain-containing protein [Candidatus Omnitrophica bacterium]|nr:zf-HC2 domain-containing protein [Candidatus Omnitrophota bacterium]